MVDHTLLSEANRTGRQECLPHPFSRECGADIPVCCSALNYPEQSNREIRVIPLSPQAKQNGRQECLPHLFSPEM
jgi:hypothetical protein